MRGAFLVRRFRDLATGAPRLRQADRNSLLTARDFFSRSSAAKCALLALVHRPFYFLLRLPSVLRHEDLLCNTLTARPPTGLLAQLLQQRRLRMRGLDPRYRTTHNVRLRASEMPETWNPVNCFWGNGSSSESMTTCLRSVQTFWRRARTLHTSPDFVAYFLRCDEGIGGQLY